MNDFSDLGQLQPSEAGAGHGEEKRALEGRGAAAPHGPKAPAEVPDWKRVRTAAKGALEALERGDEDVARALLDWLLVPSQGE